MSNLTVQQIDSRLREIREFLHPQPVKPKGNPLAMLVAVVGVGLGAFVLGQSGAVRPGGVYTESLDTLPNGARQEAEVVVEGEAPGGFYVRNSADGSVSRVLSEVKVEAGEQEGTGKFTVRDGNTTMISFKPYPSDYTMRPMGVIVSDWWNDPLRGPMVSVTDDRGTHSYKLDVSGAEAQAFDLGAVQGCMALGDGSVKVRQIDCSVRQ